MERLEKTRAEAESLRNVSADSGGGGVRGRLSRSAEPLARAQRAFNDAMLRLVDALSERVDQAAAQAGEAERRSRELEERLLRLERRGPAVGSVASQPRQDALPDYFAFESRLRAPTAEVRERQRHYVDVLAGSAPVLDLGCGRGELLALLRDAGIEARGVDADADMASYARGEQLEVEQADALDALEAAPDGSLGAVTALQLVEHLPPATLIRFLRLGAEKVRPGGVLLLETINPASPHALQNYFADLTHSQPLVPATLELLVREAGFGDVQVQYLNPPSERLRAVELPPEAEWDAARAALEANRRLLDGALFAPLDYAIVARR